MTRWQPLPGILCVVCLSAGIYLGRHPAAAQETARPSRLDTAAEADRRPAPGIARVIHGAISFEAGEAHAAARIDPPIDPARSIVLLSDAVVPADANHGNPRCGAAVIELTPTRLALATDLQQPRRLVSFQIIVYE